MGFSSFLDELLDEIIGSGVMSFKLLSDVLLFGNKCPVVWDQGPLLVLSLNFLW